MCGITGFRREARDADDARRLERMVLSLQHRGPDAQTGMLASNVALGHTRLSILDHVGGEQPMRDARTGAVITFNGEVFNHEELRAAMPEYPFRTKSDTEVLLAAFLRYGLDVLPRLNGQYAFAVWEPLQHRLTLARDPFGICPLYWTSSADGRFAFASELKALIAGGFADRKLDADGVLQSLTCWAPVPPRTAVAGLWSLRPGAALAVDLQSGALRHHTAPPLHDRVPEDSADREHARRGGSWEEAVREALDRAVRLRLVADVPVGTYLSGGLDSSLITALAQRATGGKLRTFSVGFSDTVFDERKHQEHVAQSLGTEHRVTEVSAGTIAGALPQVVALAEQPLVRTAPVPFHCLAGIVRRTDVRVVLSGEGADELFLGYDLFREAKVRSFCARQPASTFRPRLLSRLYPYLSISTQGPALLAQAFGIGSHSPGDALFSHELRFNVGRRMQRLLTREFVAQLTGDPLAPLLEEMPSNIRAGSVLKRAQWLEQTTLLSGYLLSAQGDRMLLGNGIEGRFPFLDPAVVQLALSIPEHVRLPALREKRVLKLAAKGLIPDSVLRRDKYPYRAPVAEVIVGPDAPAELQSALTPESFEQVGVFVPALGQRLLAKARGNVPLSETDNLWLVGVATTQLLGKWLTDYSIAIPENSPFRLLNLEHMGGAA